MRNEEVEEEDAEDERQAAHILQELAFELKGYMPRMPLRGKPPKSESLQH